MSDATNKTTSLTLTIDSAQQIFTDLLSRKPSEQALTLIRQQPQQALACLQQIDDSQLSPQASARVLEIIVGEQPDEVSKELLQEHLTEDRLVEMLVAQGDLDSIAATIAAPQTIAQAVLQIASTKDLDEVRRWGYKLKDRADYGEVLKRSIGRHRFEEWLVLSIERHFSREEEGVPLSAWSEVGLEVEEAYAILARLAHINLSEVDELLAAAILDQNDEANTSLDEDDDDGTSNNGDGNDGLDDDFPEQHSLPVAASPQNRVNSDDDEETTAKKEVDKIDL